MTSASVAVAEPRVGRGLIVLLCLTGAAGTFSLGAFPALLPEIAASAALADWQLGVLAGAFALARMLSNIPIGLFVGRSSARALVLAPVIVSIGALVLTSGTDFPPLVLGRALMGLGHALGMVGGLTVILRAYGPRAVSSALNAFELCAILGMLSGVALAALMPGELGWRPALLLACAPILLQLALLPLLLRALPERAPALAELPAARGARAAEPPRQRSLVPVAFAAGAVLAVAYSTVEHFLVPVRGSREFGLDRVGIARLLAVIQVADIIALLPVGTLSDRRGARVMLAAVLITLGAGIGLVGFGTLPLAFVGAALFGLGMAGWMLPLSVLRGQTPPELIAWRTAVYRVGVDGGMFLGPSLSGLLAGGPADGVLPGVLAAALGVLAVLLLRPDGARR